MKKSIIGGSIVSIFIIALGGYFFVGGSKPDDLNSTRNKLQSVLVVAQDKLNQEKQKLNNMLSDIKQSFALAVSVQDQMRQATAVVNKTNIMFKDANGVNPKLIVKNPLTNIPIDDERKNINTILAEWEKKSNISSLKLINITESEKILKNAETIQNYLDELSQIMENLTPENSGLSQFQLDTYLQHLPSAEEIQQVINTITNAIQDAEDNIATSPQSVTPPAIDTTPPPQPETPPATLLDEAIAQQAVVDAAQNQVNYIQEQINQIETEIPPPPVDTTIPPVEILPPEVSPEVPPVDSGNNTINYDVKRTIDKNQGIIVQPGEPRLIQGTDPY